LEHQQRFAPACGSFGQIDGFAELFDGDRLALRHAQRTAVGELKRPVDRSGHPILRGLGEPAEQPEPPNRLGFVDQRAREDGDDEFVGIGLAVCGQRTVDDQLTVGASARDTSAPT
jgi:hypothetical protein